MHCRSCNYTLWNLSSRQCPECGQGFKPSDFEFTPGSVRYLCPVCSKAYYGTSAKGHLVPASFDCVQCGTHISMDEMVLTPAAGISDDLTAPVELPWLDRRRDGRLAAFVRTCVWAFGRPGDIGRSIPASGSAGKAWRFLVMSQVLPWMGQIGGFLIFPLLVVGGGGRMGFLIGWIVSVIVFVLVTAVIAVPLWSVATHLLLRLTGPTRGTTDVTLSTLCFTSGANLPTVIPFVGYLIGPIWWCVAGAIAIKESQRVSGWRAALSVFALPVLAVGLFFAAYIGLVAWGMGMAGRAMTTAMMTGGGASVTSSAQASMVAISLMGRDDGVVDPVQGVIDGEIPASFLVVKGSATPVDSWTISGVSLSDLQFLSAEEARLLRDRLRTDTTPRPAGERRLGDTVFYTAGVDASNDAHAGVWVLVFWPDPGVNRAELPTWTITAASADGSAMEFGMADFDGALEAQNALREQLGLPLIPHPRLVR